MSYPPFFLCSTTHVRYIECLALPVDPSPPRNFLLQPFIPPLPTHSSFFSRPSLIMPSPNTILLRQTLYPVFQKVVSWLQSPMAITYAILITITFALFLYQKYSNLAPQYIDLTSPSPSTDSPPPELQNLAPAVESSSALAAKKAPEKPLSPHMAAVVDALQRAVDFARDPEARERRRKHLEWDRLNRKLPL